MPPVPAKPTRPKFSITWVIIGVLALMLLHDAWNKQQAVAPLPYSQFQKLLDEEKKKASRDAEQQVVGEIERSILEKLACDSVAESRQQRSGEVLHATSGARTLRRDST